jgi:hypothetical protein
VTAAGLAAFGVLPVRGPLDEAVLLVVGILLWVFYRERLRLAWTTAAGQGLTSSSRP